MMKYEFEELAGYEVSSEDYDQIIEPMYMATSLNKIDFVKCLSRKRFEKKPQKIIKIMRTRDRSGYCTTPNGCYYYIQYVELVTVDIKTGKYVVKPLSDDDLKAIRRGGYSTDLDYEYDFDYMQCVDTRHRPITLGW